MENIIYLEEGTAMCTLHHMKPSKVIHIGSLTNLIVKQHRRGRHAGGKLGLTIMILLLICTTKSLTGRLRFV